MQSQNMSCINCGKLNHMTKNCREPKISYGIILIHINHSFDHNKIFNLLNSDKFSNNNGIHIDNEEGLVKFTKYKNLLSFLMVQRKHTLGLLEFIRGNYDISNTESITHLFKQMTPKEIDDLKTLQFIDIWKNIYGTEKKYELLFNESKSKFNKLKTDVTNLKLDYYLNNIKPEYDILEWGFPKGRRNKYESDYDCALREFKEETNFKENFYVLDKLGTIEENLIGTNGIHYRHIYYIGITFNSSISITSDSTEINDVKFLCAEEAVDVIRPYHYNKKSIIIRIYEYFMNILINN